MNRTSWRLQNIIPLQVCPTIDSGRCRPPMLGKKPWIGVTFPIFYYFLALAPHHRATSGNHTSKKAPRLVVAPRLMSRRECPLNRLFWLGAHGKPYRSIGPRGAPWQNIANTHDGERERENKSCHIFAAGLMTE